MLKTVLAAVLMTGLFTPVATAAPPSTCLEPPTSDKNELCVDLLSYGDKEFAAYGRFLPANGQVPATVKVAVQQRLDMWPEPITIVEKTVSGIGEVSAVTDAAKSRDDSRTVRACATGWTELGSRSYEICTPWQGV